MDDNIPDVIHHQDFIVLHRKYSKAKFDVIQRDETIDALKRENSELRDTLSHMRSKVEGLEYVKELSVDLQNKLGFASGQVDELRSEEERRSVLLNQRTRALEKFKATAEELAERAHELEAALAAARGELEQTRAELGAARAAAEQEAGRGRQVEGALGLQQQLVTQLAAEKARLAEQGRALGDRLEQSQLAADATLVAKEEAERELGRLRELSRAFDGLRADAATLRADNGRLVRLLCSTKEYREFQKFWEDSDGVSYIPERATLPLGGGGGDGPYRLNLSRDPTFLNGHSTGEGPLFEEGEGPSAALVQTAPGWGQVEAWRARYAAGGGGGGGGGDQGPLDPEAETSDWVPREAAAVGNRLAVDLAYCKGGGGGEAHKALVDAALAQLNRTWNRRENRRVRRLRAHWKEKIEEVKRKANMAQSYETVVAKQHVLRLEKKVQALKREGGEGGGGGGKGGRRRRRRQPGYDGPTASSILMAENNLLRSYTNARDQIMYEQVSPGRRRGGGGGGAGAASASGAWAGGGEAEGRRAEQHRALKAGLLEKSLATVGALESRLAEAEAEAKAALVKGAAWFGKNATLLLRDLERKMAEARAESATAFRGQAAQHAPGPAGAVLAALHEAALGRCAEAAAAARAEVARMAEDLDYARKLRDLKGFARVAAQMPVPDPDQSPQRGS